MATKKKQQCDMDGCDNVADGSLGFCKCCYAYMYYWHKKPLKAILNRVKAVERADKRIKALRTRRMHPIAHINART